MFTDRIETATAVSENGAPSLAPIVLPNAANEVLDQHGHQNAKVMVVDDESSNVNTLRTYLADEGSHNFVATA